MSKSMSQQDAEVDIAPPGPCAVVIFGASGDLTKRLLMPALYNLATNKLLPESFAVVGVAIDDMDTGAFREQLALGVRETASREIDASSWDAAFGERLYYVGGDFENPETYQRLKNQLAEIDRDRQTAGNYLFYLAVPPTFFGKIIQQLAAAELTEQVGDTAVKHMQPNIMLLRIQPDEGISLSFEAKRPGILVCTDSVNMDFSYAGHFGPTTFVGYETLLYDCMTGDQTLFQRADFVEAGWRAITPILDVWSNLPARKFPNYTAGTWGPPDAEELLGRDGRQWRRP